jgi:hypothetical protein
MKKICLSASLWLLLCCALFAQTGGEDLAVLNRMMRLKMDGLIPLRFSSALDGKPIAGARVSVGGIGVFVTDSQGIISFPEQEDGFYTLSFSKEGFVSAEIEFEVKLNNVFSNRFSISPELRGEYLCIVLDWNQSPADLDVHLEKEGGYHLSFRNAHSAEDGSVLLDRDDRDGFGPETITIMETDPRAVYRLYVHDYSNSSSGASTALSRSGAVVRVYKRGGLAAAFIVPANRPGNRWNEFKMVNGRIEGE